MCDPSAGSAADPAVPIRPPDEFTEDSSFDRFPIVKWQSVERRMAHYPMLADCPICQCATKKRKQHHSRPNEDHPEAKKFGDILTVDFISAYNERIGGLSQLTGDDEALIIVDIAT